MLTGAKERGTGGLSSPSHSLQVSGQRQDHDGEGGSPPSPDDSQRLSSPLLEAYPACSSVAILTESTIQHILGGEWTPFDLSQAASLLPLPVAYSRRELGCESRGSDFPSQLCHPTCGSTGKSLNPRAPEHDDNPSSPALLRLGELMGPHKQA